MWCAHCKKEYDDIFDTCLICGGKLEKYVPILSEEERDVLNIDREDEIDIGELLPKEVLPQLLVTVVGKEEAHRLVELLEHFKIPCMCRIAQTEDDEWENCSEEPLYDLLVPQMMIRKALRILNDDEERNGEVGDEEEILCETLTPPMEEEKINGKKMLSGFFSLFGKK